MEGVLIIHPTIQYEEKDTYQDVIQEDGKKIFLGSIASRKYIAHENIKWVIEILSPNEYGHPIPNNTHTYRFEFDDNRNVNLYEWVNKIIPIINNEKGNGLIHCREGRSRSSAILIAYLIHYHHMTYDEALDKIRLKRPIVRPNIGFERQLRNLEKIK